MNLRFIAQGRRRSGSNNMTLVIISLAHIKRKPLFFPQVGVDTPPIIFNLLEEQEKAFRANQQATAQKLLTCS